jgi:NAD(P)-dependent dehydrogenase (short-subunit alcohol dehydrogenase family)
MGFAKRGDRVVGLGRTAQTLEQTLALCAPDKFSFKVVDVTDSAAVEAAIGGMNPVDAIICNAATYPRAYFLDQPADEWSRTILINVCGVANCCRAVLPRMLERNHGRIVIIGSLADLNPIPSASAYSVSKGALHALTRAISAEIDRQRYPDVLINEFNPSATRTAMSDGGDDPSATFPRIARLVDFPAGGPTGRSFMRDTEVRLNETPKGMVKRLLLRLLGRRS